MTTASIPVTLIYGAKGATQVAAQSRSIAQSLKGITGATRMMRAGLLGISSMVMGAQASFVILGLAVRRAIQQYSAYTEAQSRLRTTLATGDRNVRVHTMVLRQYSESVGRDLGYSLNEATTGMNQLIEAGWNSHEAMAVMRSSMELARVGMMSTDQATRFMSDSMNIFRNEWAETGESLQEFSGRMVAQLGVAAAATSSSIEELQSAFRMAGSELATFGYGSRESISALAGLSTVGIRGGSAGYRMRSAMVALRNPARRTIETLSQITHVSFEEAEAQFRNLTANADGSSASLIETMERLQAMFRGVGTEADRQRLASRIFGRSSLAAGAGLANLTSVGDRTREVYDRLANSRELAATWDRMERERMRSFAMQLQQTTHAVNDLAISFGSILFSSMSTGEEGFGSYMRRLSEGVMLIGQLNGTNTEARDRWNALSPEIRENARWVRQLMQDIASLLRFLVESIPTVVRFVREHRNLTIALVVLSSVFGGVGGAISTLGPIIVTAIGHMGRFVVATNNMSTASAAGKASVGAMALAILVAGDITARSLTSTARSMDEYRDYYTQLDNSIGRSRMQMIESIPLIGGILAAFVRFARVAFDAFRETYRWIQRALGRDRDAEISLTRSAGESIDERTARYRRVQGTSESDAIRLGRESALTESLQRWAILAFSQGIREREDISSSIRGFGFDESRVDQMTDFVRRTQMTMHRNREMPAAIEATRGRLREAEAIHAANRQLRGFAEAVGNATQQFAASPSVPSNPWDWESDAPSVQDGYARRGGLVSVASDDLIVNRSRLADVVSAGRGEFAGLALGGAGGEIAVTVPVIVDGREIARAVGRAQVRQMERGGARLDPGQRRSLRETGSERRVG